MRNGDPADNDRPGPFDPRGVHALMAALRRQGFDDDTKGPPDRSVPPGSLSGPRERIRLPMLNRARGGGDPDADFEMRDGGEHDPRRLAEQIVNSDPRRLAEQIVNHRRKPRMTGTSVGTDGEITED